MSLRLLGVAALLISLTLYLPVITLFAPFWELELLYLWAELFKATEFGPALAATLVSTLASLAVALGLSYLLMGALVFTPAYQRFARQLPLLLAVPHLAFAVGLYLLLSPKGWLERLVAPMDVGIWVQDGYGLSLAVALGIKESWFLCWMIWAQLQQSSLADQFLVAQCQGYQRGQIVRQILVPQLLPKLRWPLLAVAAYSLSSVEMAWVLGPTHPPTLAVLAWNWMLDPMVEQRDLGMALTLLLMVLMLALSLTIWQLPRVFSGIVPSGRRRVGRLRIGLPAKRLLLMLHLVLGLLILLWSFTHSWFYPALLPGRWSLNAWQSLAVEPLLNTLSLGLVSALLAIALVLLVLEAGIKQTGWILLPLFLPVLPLVVGQYQISLFVGMPPSWSAVLLAHLLWVLPYVYLVLKPAYLALPHEQLLTARTLGLNQTDLFMRVKLPLLLRPICAAFALGFSVSLAQYLPTIFIGAGRVETLTTETLSRFAGGDKRLLGAQAMALLAVALLAYILAQRLPQIVYAKRRAMD